MDISPWHHHYQLHQENHVGQKDQQYQGLHAHQGSLCHPEQREERQNEDSF